MRWQALGKLLFVQQQGGQPVGYAFEVKGDKLSVAGGDLNGTVTLSRGTAAAVVARKDPVKNKPTDGQELVGKWCKMTTFSATSGGGSQRSTCFELRADGTYTYHHEGSMSAYAPGAYGGTASQSSDAGRWKVSGTTGTALRARRFARARAPAWWIAAARQTSSDRESSSRTRSRPCGISPVGIAASRIPWSSA